MINFAREAQEYRPKVERFIKLNKLPRHWFLEQDHVAFKAYNPQDYEVLVKQFKPASEQISEVHMDGRQIAVAKLLDWLGIDMTLSFSGEPHFLDLVELMLARPEDQSDEPVKLDHEEIYFERGIIPIRTVLRRKGLNPLDQENDAHSWVSVIMNDEGDELKFTDRRLEDINAEDLKTGRAKIIHP